MGGILIETGLTSGSVCHAVVGLGINVNMAMAGFPEIVATATSLSDELGKELSRLTLLQEVLRQFERWYMACLAGEPVFESWRDRLSTLGRVVSLRVGDTIYTGCAEDVAGDGSLVLRQPDGRLVSIPAGDVSLRT